MEFMDDQQLIIQQLKEMLRKSERELQDKDRELEDSVAKFQKLKLQSKAKISQLTNQLKEREKMKESSMENLPASSSTTDSSEQRNRGKIIMLKKQLDDAKQAYEKMEKGLTTEKEMLQNTLEQLEAKVKEKDEIILLNKEKSSASLSSELPQNPKDSSRVQEMYAQMVYKDSKIMELNELISERERKIMDLQEFVKEKEEVLQARNRAVHSGDDSQLAALQQKIAELEEEKGTLQLKLLGFEENSSSQESDEKEGSPHSFESENSLLVEKLRNEITTLENRNEDQEAKLEDTQNILQQIQESHNQKDAECDKLKQNVQDLENMQEEICRKMDALQFSVDEKDIKIAEMLNTLRKYEEEKVSLEMKIIELEEQKDMIESKEKELLQEKKCWQDTIENEKQIIMDIQKEKDEVLAELEEIKIAWKTTEEKNTKLQDNLSHLQDGCDQLVQKNITLQEELHSMISENEKQSREMSNLQQQLDDLQMEFIREKENHRFILEQNEDKERQLMIFFNKYSIADISDLENKWKENLDVLNDLENSLETETISNSLQIKELEHMLETKEISFKEEVIKLEEIIKNGESEKHSLEILINEKDGIIASFQRTSNENESYLLETIKEKERVILQLLAEISEIKNTKEQQMIKFSEEKQIMESELLSLRKSLDEYELSIASIKEQLHQSNQNNEDIQQELLELKLQKEQCALQFEIDVKQHKDTVNKLDKKLEVVQDHLNTACIMLSLEQNDSVSLEEKLSSILKERENHKSYEKELQDQLEDISKQMKELEEQLSNYKAKNAVLQEMFEKSEKDIEDYKEQITEIKKSVNKYENEVYSLSKMVEEMKEENSRLTNKLTSSECQVETNNNELQRLMNELNDLKQRYKEAIMCNEEIEREIVTKVYELNSSNKIIEQLKIEMETLQNSKDEMGKELKTICEKSEILNDDIRKKEQLCDSLQEILTNKETEIVNLKSLQKQFDNLDGNLYEANEKISKLESEVRTKIKYLQDIEQILQDNALAISNSLEEASYNPLISEKDEKNQDRIKQENKLDIWMKQIDENNLDKFSFYVKVIKEGIQNSASIKRTLKNELAASNDIIVTLKSQHEFEINHLTKVLEKETERATQLNADVESMKLGSAEMVTNFSTAIQALQDRIQTFEMEKSELLKEVKMYEQINSSLSEQIELMKDNEESYKNKILQSEEKMSEYTEKMNEMTRKCKDLSTELSNSTALHSKFEAMKLDMQQLKYCNEEERLNHMEEKKTFEKIIEDYKVTMEQLKKENKEWDEKNTFLTSELDAHKTQLQQYETRLQEILLQLKEKEDKILVLEAQSVEWQKSLKHMQADVERLQFFENEYHTTVNEFKCTEENIKEKEITIDNLIKENENIKKGNEMLQIHISELTEQLKETKENFGKQKVALQQHIRESSNQLLGYEDQLNKTKQNISILEKTLQEKDILLAEHNKEKEVLLSELEMIEKLHNEMKFDTENLKVTIDAERNENSAMKEYIKKMEEEKLKLVDHVHMLEKENLSSQTKLLELNDTANKYEDLKLELSKSKEHVSLLETSSADNVQKLSTALEKSNAHILGQESKIHFLENSLENLKKLMQEVEDQNKSLEKEASLFKSNTTKELEEREKEIFRLTTKLNETEVFTKNLQQQIKILQVSENHLIEMQTLVTDLETKLKDSFAQVSSLSEQLQENNDDILKYKKALEIQDENLKEQMKTNEQLHSENLNVIGEIKILHNKFQESDELNCVLKQQIDELHLSSKERNEKYNIKILEYESEIGSLKSSLENSRKTLTELQMQYNELQSVNLSLKESMRSLQDEKDPMCERQNVLHELQNSNNALEYEVQSLRSEFCKIEEERNRLMSCLNEMSRKIQNLEQNSQMYLEEKASLLKQIESLKITNENLSKDEHLKIDSLEVELKRLSAENKDFQQKLNIDNEQLCSDLKLEISEYNDKVVCLETKLKDAEMIIRTLTKECDSKKSIEDETQNDISELRNIIQNKDAEYDKLLGKYKELLSTNEFLSLDLHKFHSNCESLEKEINFLKESSEKREQEIIAKQESVKENKAKNNIKKSTDMITSSESVPQIERELIQRKEATSDMTQKLAKENEVMKNNLDVQKIKLEKMFAKLKAFKEKNDQLQEENKIVNIKLNSIQNEKDLMESEITEKTELLRRLTNEGEKSMSSYQKDILERENSISRLKEENKLLTTRYQQIEMELYECSRSKENMTFSLEKKSRELDDLLIRLQQMEKDQTSLEEQLANYDRQCTQLHYEKDCIQRELEDMKGQMEMLSSDNETFQGLLENLQKSKIVLEAELQKQREQHIKSFKEAQNIYLQDTEKLKKALHQSELNISTLQDQCRDFEENCAKFDRNLRNNNDELAGKEKENIALQEKNTFLSNELTKVLQELHSLRSFSSWESDIMDTELNDKIIGNKQDVENDKSFDTKLMASLKEAESKLQQKVNMLEDELEQQGKDYNLKLQEMERNILELHFQLNEMTIKNENLSTMLMDREKQWSEEMNMWQKKETSFQLHIRNLENQLKQISHPPLIQNDEPRLVLEESILQTTNENSNSDNLLSNEKVDQLKQELQQVMYSLHSQSLRSENLSQEVSKLIEEKNTLQHQLSYYVKMAHSKEKEQRQRSTENERIVMPFSENTSSLIQESTQLDVSTGPNTTPPNEELNAKAETRLVNVQLELESLYQRIQESKQANEELQKVNDNLDEALRAERIRRKLIEEELSFAKEEAILNSSTPLNNEYRLLIDEDEPHMFPETNYSINRRVKTHAYRLQHWLRRKRNHCYRIFRRMPGLQILFYIYILIIHVWFLICLF